MHSSRAVAAPNPPVTQKPRTISSNNDNSSITSGCFWGANITLPLGFATRSISGARQSSEEQSGGKNEVDRMPSRKPSRYGRHCRLQIKRDDPNAAPLRKKARMTGRRTPETLDKASTSTTGDVPLERGLWSVCPPHLAHVGSLSTSDEGERKAQIRPPYSDLTPSLIGVVDHSPSPGPSDTRVKHSFVVVPNAEHSRIGGMVRQDDGASPGRRRGRFERSAASRRLGGILAVYGKVNPLFASKTSGSGKSMPSPNDQPGGAYCDGGVRVRKLAGGKAVGLAASAAGIKTSERGKRIEAIEAAMESPLTYEEQVRRERLAHLKITYAVEKEIAALPMEFLRGGNYQLFGIKRRLWRMCAVIKISHRWTAATALARWATTVERALAVKFAQDMLRYKQSRIFDKLVAAKSRLELKHVRKRFSKWKRGVRLARLAKDKASSIDAANKIQRWVRRHLDKRRRFRASESRRRRRAAEAREKANAIVGVFAFEDDRRKVLRRTLRLLHEKQRFNTMHRAAAVLQRAWLRYVRRCRVLGVAEEEREKLRRRRLKIQARRWAIISPMAKVWISACLDLARRAAITKIHAVHEHQRLVYEVELEEYIGILTEAQSVLSRIWRCKGARMKAVARRKAANSMQRAWRKAAQRWILQEEIKARVEETAVRIAALHEAAARRLQHFGRKSADRRRLFRRFDARRARLDFEARNRAELASAILILAPSRNLIREHSSPEDLEAVSDAVMPAVAVARMRTAAAACGISIEDLSLSAGTLRVENGDMDESKLGAQLAWSVLREQETQQRATINMQRLWRWKKRRIHMEDRFRERSVKLLKDKQERGARAFQRTWKCARLRGEVAARVEKTRIRVTTEREAGARRLQVFTRWRRDIKKLEARFAVRKISMEQARKAKLTHGKEAEARARGASEIQGWWRRIQARNMLKRRLAKRVRLMAKIAEKEDRSRVENTVARVLQRTWTRHCEREKMALRFKLRRKVLDETRALEESKRLEMELLAKQKLEEEKRMHREHEATKVKLLLVTAERDRKAEEAASHLINAWKLGYDQENARNYWFNHVTGESSLTRPEGWTIKPSERWSKQMNKKGLVYYLDLETDESHWFPPCEQCYKREGERTCKDCEDRVYCERCWTMAHKAEDMADHHWKGADSGKEELQPGEQHCVDCRFRKAKVVCLQCKDALCQECNARIHGSGHRKSHNIESFVKAKKGWQTVDSRTENESTFYFNATTNESTFDKPQELMVPEELFEHKRFLEYKSTNEKYVRKIEKLEFQLEELMYEKDKIAYQWANAQKDIQGQGDETKRPGRASLGKIKFGRTKRTGKSSPKTQDKEEAYEKSLLLSRKEKKEMGFEIKLKK